MTLVSEGASIRAKETLDRCWSLNVISSALESGVKARQEVVQMCGNDAGAMLQCHLHSTHDKGEGEHCPWEQFNRDLNNDKVCLFPTVVLCEGVDEGEDERRCENVSIEEKTCRNLRHVMSVLEVPGPGYTA